jgi:tetratricopeptide (TPR) repeat protein
MMGRGSKSQRLTIASSVVAFGLLSLAVRVDCAARVELPRVWWQQAQTAQGKTQKLKNPLNDLLEEAQAAMDKNDYEAAIPPLQKFLAEQPDVAYAHFQLAYAYTALKRPTEARAEYERCIALDPKMAEAQLNLGILLLNADPKAAIAPLSKAVDLQPSQSRPRYLLGIAQERLGDLAGAAQSFEGATHLDSKDAEALTHLGGVMLRLGKPAEAEGKFRQALEIEPKSPAALQGLAQSLELQKKPGAAEAYRDYLAVQPSDAAAEQRVIHTLLEQKKYDAALAELDKLPETNPPSLETLKLRADILIGQKKTDEAIAVLQQAIQLAPNDAQLQGGLGRLYMDKKDYASAEKELKVALNLDRNNVVYWKDLSSAYYLAGNYPAALTAMDLIDKQEVPGAGAWFIRALCYDKLNQAQSALEAYRKFLELDQNRNPDQVWQATERIHVLEKTVQKKK